MTSCVYAARATWPTTVLCLDVAAAIGMGTSISEVLRVRNIRRTSYYRWLSIGRGQLLEWWDGCAIDDDARSKCWELAMAVTRAHLDNAQIELEQLRLVEPCPKKQRTFADAQVRHVSPPSTCARVMGSET